MYQTYTSYSINIPKLKFFLHLELNVLCNYQIKQKLENYLFIFYCRNELRLFLSFVNYKLFVFVYQNSHIISI